MAFCDFCSCEDCKTGIVHHVDLSDKIVRRVSSKLSHAPTADGRWICDLCWRYTVCSDAKRAEGLRNGSGPCEELVNGKIVPIQCSHRPVLVGPFTLLFTDGFLDHLLEHGAASHGSLSPR